MPPVNETKSTSLCADSGSPTSEPLPNTRLMTPLGKPTSSINSNTRIVVNGVISLGFITKEQPVANAGAIFQDA